MQTYLLRMIVGVFRSLPIDLDMGVVVMYVFVILRKGARKLTARSLQYQRKRFTTTFALQKL